MVMTYEVNLFGKFVFGLHLLKFVEHRVNNRNWNISNEIQLHEKFTASLSRLVDFIINCSFVLVIPHFV